MINTYVNPVAFEILGLEIRWYALCIVAGMLVAYFFSMKVAKKMDLKEGYILDGFLFGIIIGVIGARIYYCIFEWESYKNNIWSIFDPRGGWQGLAIHGGIIAGSVFAVIYCKIRKMNVFKVGELLFVGFLIGQIFGRWGNFFNHEAYGENIFNILTYGNPGMFTPDLLSRLLIPQFVIENMHIGAFYWHPTFLYEMLWNIAGVFAILILRNTTKKYWVGDAISFYLVWYSFGRFFIEGLRTDALNSLFLGMRQAQVISVVMIIAGIALFIARRVWKIYPVPYMDEVEKNINAPAINIADDEEKVNPITV